MRTALRARSAHTYGAACIALCPHVAVTPRSTGSRALTGQPRILRWARICVVEHACARASTQDPCATHRLRAAIVAGAPPRRWAP
eukprot:6698378-Alexandrium_andersonii.AAC.1